MQWKDYAENMKTMTSWYRRSMDEKQHDILFNQVKHIPLPAFKEIVESIINDSKYFPTIQEIKNRFQSWRSAHPDQATGYERTPCLDCHGKGFIWTLERNEDLQHNYSHVYRCGACNNWQGHIHPSALPALHRSIAEREGKKIVFPKYRAKSADDLKPTKTKNLKPNTNQIGRPL